MKTVYFEEGDGLEWNGLIYPLNSFDLQKYTKVSSSINDKYLKRQTYYDMKTHASSDEGVDVKADETPSKKPSMLSSLKETTKLVADVAST